MSVSEVNLKVSASVMQLFVFVEFDMSHFPLQTKGPPIVQYDSRNMPWLTVLYYLLVSADGSC